MSTSSFRWPSRRPKRSKIVFFVVIIIVREEKHKRVERRGTVGRDRGGEQRGVGERDGKTRAGAEIGGARLWTTIRFFSIVYTPASLFDESLICAYLFFLSRDMDNWSDRALSYINSFMNTTVSFFPQKNQTDGRGLRDLSRPLKSRRVGKADDEHRRLMCVLAGEDSGRSRVGVFYGGKKTCR